MSHDIRYFTAPKVQRIVDTIVAGDWRRAETYGDLLAQIHYYVSYTTRILAYAGARCTLDQQALHMQCMRHAGEEKGHEHLTLSDLRALGLSVEQFDELPATKNLYRNAFYLIEHVSPAAILGYAYLLETLSVAAGIPMLKIIEPLHGRDAVRHMAVHASEDPNHVSGLEKVIAGLRPAERACVLEAIATTAHEFEQILVQVQARGTSAGVRKAA